jgi:signal transduction histidine kinase
VTKVRRRHLVDLAIALAFACLGTADTFARLSPPEGTAPARTALVPVLLVSAALVMRRTAPLSAVSVIVVAIVVPAVTAEVRLVYWGELMPWLVALYSLGRHGTRRHAYAGVLASMVGFLALAVRYPGLRAPGDALYDMALMVAATAIGSVVHQRAALHLENARLDEDRLLAAENATAAERARIARELHDVISHGISTIVLQAGGARVGFAQDPQAAQEALNRIERIGRESLAELRVMLEVMRVDDVTEDADVAPAPTLRRLADLVEHHRRLGLTVHLDAHEQVADVPLPVQLSAYRIVQEGLTNVHKHAGSAPTTVSVTLSEVLAIEVRNDPGTAVSPRPTSGGFGLLGLRERVAVLGGWLQAGRTPDGGFRLYAEVPMTMEAV